jgi:hypothetical protein
VRRGNGLLLSSTCRSRDVSAPFSASFVNAAADLGKPTAAVSPSAEAVAHPRRLRASVESGEVLVIEGDKLLDGVGRRDVAAGVNANSMKVLMVDRRVRTAIVFIKAVTDR